MKRGLLLVGWLISVSACDFDTEYERIWCVRHPTTPKCVDGGIQSDAGADAGELDAGELDAGELDAGGADAGGADAGEPDAGAPDAGCARKLVIETTATPPLSAHQCVGLQLGVRCVDDDSIIGVTRLSTLTLGVTPPGTYGRFFSDAACLSAVTGVALPAGATSATVFFDSTKFGNDWAFGRFNLFFTSSGGDPFAAVALPLDLHARLTFEDAGAPLFVPVGNDCVAVPRPVLVDVNLPNETVVANTSLTLVPPAANSVWAYCGSTNNLLISAGANRPLTGLQVRASAAGESWLLTYDPGSPPPPLDVQDPQPLMSCQTAGPTTMTSFCCAGSYFDGGGSFCL